MKKSSKAGEMQCAVDYAFQRIGGKYKGRILWELNGRVKRYGELRKSLEDITPKMLTQALRELEQDALIIRTVYLEVPLRVEYQLSETGKELVPFIQLLSKWAKQQMTKHNIPIMKVEAI
jgi:DNA-binding HxlR family transcriptional regulator